MVQVRRPQSQRPADTRVTLWFESKCHGDLYAVFRSKGEHTPLRFRAAKHTLQDLRRHQKTVLEAVQAELGGEEPNREALLELLHRSLLELGFDIRFIKAGVTPRGLLSYFRPFTINDHMLA